MKACYLKELTRLEQQAETLKQQKNNNTDDPVTFAKKLGFNLDPWQVRLVTSRSKRIILNCSRQSGKSTACALLALYYLIHKQNSVVIALSPSLRQSLLLSSKVLELRQKLINPPTLLEDNKTNAWFEKTNARFFSLPSKEETIRGISAVTLAIVDEAAFCDADLIRAVLPMLATTNGQLILLSTPRGRTGFFYEAWESTGWEKIQVTALDCSRISKEFLESERKTLPDHWFRQEYLCEFTDSEFAIFRTEDIDRAFEADFELFNFL